MTLYRPYPWAIFHWPASVYPGPKRLENRRSPPPKVAYDEPIALHAGKKWSHEGHQFMRAFVDCPHENAAYPRASGADPVVMVHPTGAIVGLVRVTGWVYAERGKPLRFSGTDEDTAEQLVGSSWFFGPYAWILDDVVALKQPVPHRGLQGLWPVEPAAARAVLAQTT